jgi:type IV pilus assembly protein PilY1
MIMIKMPNRTRLSLAIASLLGVQGVAHAQLIINDTLTGGHSSYGWTPLGGACLTAGDGTGSIPACVGLQYYSKLNSKFTGGATGNLPDAVGSGALRLTNGDPRSGGNNGDTENGAVVSSTPFPTNQGVQVTWTTVTYGGDNLNSTGADGMSFFLSDGTQAASVGGLGGSLGYSCSNGNGVYDGVVGGYVGIGIDEYGNFTNGGSSGDNTDTAPWAVNGTTPPAFKAGRISVRGAGSTAYSALRAAYPSYYPDPTTMTSQNITDAVHNTCKSGYVYNYSSSTVNGTASKAKSNIKLAYNYPLLAWSDLPAGTTIANQEATSTTSDTTALRGKATPITYSLRITSDGILNFSYSINGGSTNTPISGLKITDKNGPLPPSFRFGFSAGTGSGSNIHEITCFKAAPGDQSDSSAGSNTQQSGRVLAGSQVYFAYFHPTNWWGQLTAQDLLYDSTKKILSISSTANWDANCVLTGGTCNATSKSTTAQSPSTRSILTWDATKGGLPFEWANITTAQQALLTAGGTSDATRLNYIRGDRSQEVTNSGSYRNRNSVLGDIVDSSPTWVGPPSAPYAGPWQDKLQSTVTAPEGTSYATFASNNAARTNVVYAGANDGMLHGFRAGAFDTSGNFIKTNNDGTEVIAYVPNAALSMIHSSTTVGVDYSNTQYSHNFYVDATPDAEELYYGGAWHTWLVGGMGPGGQAGGPINDPTASASGAIFALDITDPSKFSESNASSLVIGEWSSSSIKCYDGSSCGNNLGQTYGTPVIRRLHDGNWAVLFGNGLNSATGTAGLFIMHVNSVTGAKTLRFLDTGYNATKDPLKKSNRNGIVQVTAADLDGDHITDYVYAGDYFGNVWRFDLTSADPTNWKAGAAPIFSPSVPVTALQPITTRVTVTGVPTPTTGAMKVLVAFGTGVHLPQTLASADSYATGAQALYGVWDSDMSGWNGLSSDAKFDSLTSTKTVTPSDLQQQSVTQTIAGPGNSDVTNYRTVSNSAVCWVGSGSCAQNTQYGWTLPLPTTTEQVVFNPQAVSGLFMVNTIIPASSQILSCSNTPAAGYTMAIMMGTGGAAPQSVFQDATGSFTGINVSGVGINGSGTGSVMLAGNQSFYVTQTMGDNTNGGGMGDAKEINIPGGIGQRVNWTKIR